MVSCEWSIINHERLINLMLVAVVTPTQTSNRIVKTKVSIVFLTTETLGSQRSTEPRVILVSLCHSLP